MKFLVPILGLALGSGAGFGAGLFLTDPTPAEQADAQDEATPKPEPLDDADLEIAMLTDQFIVPVVDEQKVSALIVMSIGLEVTPGVSIGIFEQEARFRDTFLQVLFEHANMGGFDGAFTNARNLALLRSSLLKAAKQRLGDDAHGVLITDLARQDV